MKKLEQGDVLPPEITVNTEDIDEEGTYGVARFIRIDGEWRLLDWLCDKEGYALATETMTARKVDCFIQETAALAIRNGLRFRKPDDDFNEWLEDLRKT